MKAKLILMAVLVWSSLATAAFAAPDYASSTTAMSGYDLVSYQNSKRPIRGNGHFVSVQDGVTYLFANEDNTAEFDRNPGKYQPAFGGYCAFGVSVGKKFVGDPEVWRIVDGTLYLNLDENIQDLWLKDVPGRIKIANTNWTNIRDKAPSEL